MKNNIHHIYPTKLGSMASEPFNGGALTSVRSLIGRGFPSLTLYDTVYKVLLLFSVSAGLNQDFWYLEFCLWLDIHILALFSRSQICLPPSLSHSELFGYNRHRHIHNKNGFFKASLTLSCFGRLPINPFILNQLQKKQLHSALVGWYYNIRLFPQTTDTLTFKPRELLLHS